MNPEDDSRQRVRKGACLLDEVAPKWYLRVNPNSLKLFSTRTLFKDVFGGYAKGRRKLKSGDEDFSLAPYGFVEEEEGLTWDNLIFGIYWYEEVLIRKTKNRNKL